MKTSDKILLAKIRSEALIIAGMIQGHGRDSFISDEVLKRAVCMAFINIGERIKHLSGDLRSANKHIPWKSIAGARDVVAHGYDTLRMEDVWANATELLPGFLGQIEEIIENWQGPKQNS